MVHRRRRVASPAARCSPTAPRPTPTRPTTPARARSSSPRRSSRSTTRASASRQRLQRLPVRRLHDRAARRADPASTRYSGASPASEHDDAAARASSLYAPAPLPHRVDASTRPATTSTARLVATHNVDDRPARCARCVSDYSLFGASVQGALAAHGHATRPPARSSRARSTAARAPTTGRTLTATADAAGRHRDQLPDALRRDARRRTRAGRRGRTSAPAAPIASPNCALHPVPRDADRHGARDADAPARRRSRYGAGTDQAPVPGTVSLAPAAPKTNQTLTATPSGFSDPDGDPLTYHYQWFRNGTPIAGATTSTLNLAPAGNGDLRRHDPRRGLRHRRPRRGQRRRRRPRSRSPTRRRRPARSRSARPRRRPTTSLRAVPTGFADIDGDTLTYQYQWLQQRHADRRRDRAARSTSRSPATATSATASTSTSRAADGAGGTSPAARGGQNITGTNSTPVDGTVALTPGLAEDRPDADRDAERLPRPRRRRDHLPLPVEAQRHADRRRHRRRRSTSRTAGNGDRGDTITVDVTATDPQNAVERRRRPARRRSPTAPRPPGTVTVKPAAPADQRHRRRRRSPASPTPTATR